MASVNIRPANPSRVPVTPTDSLSTTIAGARNAPLVTSGNNLIASESQSHRTIASSGAASVDDVGRVDASGIVTGLERARLDMQSMDPHATIRITTANSPYAMVQAARRPDTRSRSRNRSGGTAEGYATNTFPSIFVQEHGQYVQQQGRVRSHTQLANEEVVAGSLANGKGKSKLATEPGKGKPWMDIDDNESDSDRELDHTGKGHGAGGILDGR